ncbi:hypothetical protein [Oerskovia enterophila]|uniref:Uncharacterized protein n=1 Tax=Oerskovia enterophila TaxID=43678 RepID=A0ABX2Y1S1_9CELL|nr:hypothetical protein [Oerskovia enterophila]OCI30449.1 hypothetical protein OERS_28510 [Oerskovia enterophila]
MDRRTLDVAVPVTFGLLVASSAMWFSAAQFPIMMVGGVLVGLYFSAFRQKLPHELPAPDETQRIEPPVRDRIEPARPADAGAPWGTPPAIEDRRDDA